MTRKSWIAFAVMALFVVTGVAQAQTTNLTPTVIQKEAVEDQLLQLRYVDFDNNLLGRLFYGGSNAEGQKNLGFQNNFADFLAFYTINSMEFRAPFNQTQMKIDSTGVRIGFSNSDTSTRLTVLGAIDVKGNIAAKYQDVAEWVPAFGEPKPGTVVVLSEDASNHVIASNSAYDTRVAGVVSEQPGVILGEAAPNKVQVATTGRVKVMVDATAAPIRIGDLLVTSDKPGVAMKSIPVDVAGIKMHRPGTVVGKALEPLASGTGEILVLLSMQ